MWGAIENLHLKWELPDSSKASNFESTANFFFPLNLESQNSTNLYTPSK